MVDQIFKLVFADPALESSEVGVTRSKDLNRLAVTPRKVTKSLAIKGRVARKNCSGI